MSAVATAPLVFITGASSGIGWALAAAYARQGWRLALVARRVELIEQACREAGWPETRWAVYGADVRDEAQVLAAAAACLARQGLPEVVIANAGISIGVDTALAEDLPVLRDLYATNVFGLAATFQPFIAPMRTRGGGTLVGVASVAAVRGLPGHAAYCGAKAAVVAHCESLRVELQDSGVRVVTLLPGYVRTPLTAPNRYPMPFLMSPEDFAARALRAIEGGARRTVIPWPMGVVAAVLRVLPPVLFDRLLKGRPRKHRGAGPP